MTSFIGLILIIISSMSNTYIMHIQTANIFQLCTTQQCIRNDMIISKTLKMPYTVLRLKYTVLQYKAATAFNTLDILNENNFVACVIVHNHGMVIGFTTQKKPTHIL